MIRNIIKDKFMAFVLAASAVTMLTGCSADITDNTVPARTVTATMQGIGKPQYDMTASALQGGTRTSFTVPNLTTYWDRHDEVTVTFTFYSDETGTTPIAAADCPDGQRQTLIYDNRMYSWTALPAVIRLPAATHSMKADYSYSRKYTEADDDAIDASTTAQTKLRGTENCSSTSGLLVPTDYASLDITLKPTTWTRKEAAVVISNLAQGQSATLTYGDGTAQTITSPTITTDGTNAPVNADLLTTFVYYVTPDAAGTTSKVEAATSGQSGVVPSFTTEAGKAYVIPASMLFSLSDNSNGGQTTE